MYNKFAQLEREMNQKYFERGTEIHGLMLGMLGRGSVLFLGAPGTAKTDMTQAICNAIDNGTFFETLLTRVSAPEQLFGALSLKQLENDRYVRVSTGMLQDSHVGFIDEIFKSSPAILNTLLDIMGSKIYREEGKARPIPMLLCVGASNEPPEGGSKGELGALWDRFDLRFITSYIRDERNFKSMLRLNGGQITTRLTVDEVKQAQQEVAAVKINDFIIETLARLWKELNSKGFQVSDRRFRNSLKFLRANAWLDGRDEVNEDDIPVLAHIFWTEMDDSHRKELTKIILSYGNPYLTKATEIHDAALEVVAMLNGVPEGTDEYNAKATEVNFKLRDIGKTLSKLIDTAKLEGRSYKQIEAKRNQVAGYFAEFKRKMTSFD